MQKSIFQAAHEDDIETLSSILEQQPKLASSIDEETGWSPLHFAARENAVKTAEILLKGGVDCNSCDSFGVSALQLSSGEEMIRLLRRYGACFSSNYQKLKGAQQAHHAVRATYHGQTRNLRILQPGLTGGEERCFAWQDGIIGEDTKPGLRCFRVQEMTDIQVLQSKAGLIPHDLNKMRACVGLIDKDF